MRSSILLVDDEDSFRTSMKGFLEDEGFFVKCVGNADEAISLIRQKSIPFTLALIDYRMPDLAGPRLIEKLRHLDPRLTLIGFSGDPSVEAHNDSLQSGALMFIAKDMHSEKLLGILHRVCQEVEKRDRAAPPISPDVRSELIASVGMVGASQHLADVAILISKFAQSPQTVLIRGENGTGKEKVARALHRLSPRNNGPFIAVNCGAITKELLHSELFGHAKGAFTGAHGASLGKFMAADKGTIFLDEVGEMQPDAQVALLRVLQEREITPLGSTETRKVNVRVIAATNACLEDRIHGGTFREDLYHRLNVLTIWLKPLRERPEDIPPLAHHFMKIMNAETKVTKRMTETCVREIAKAEWSGNIRELAGAVSRMHLLSDGDLIGEEALQYVGTKGERSEQAQALFNHDALMYRFEGTERTYIKKALRLGGSVSEAACLLGMSRSTLRSRMKKLGIKTRIAGMEVG